jgi:hypothetical protein
MKMGMPRLKPSFISTPDVYNDNELLIEVTTRQAVKSGPIIGHSGHCSGEVGKKSISWCPLYPGISGQVHPDHCGLVK